MTMQTMNESILMKAMVLIAVFGLLGGLTGCDKPKQKQTERPPPNVVVSDVKQKAVPIIMEMAGTVQPVKTVKIVPRVSGYIFERNFTEGSNVTEGDPLYLIDPRPYQSKLDSLKAKLEQHRASLKFWTSEAERYNKLAKKGSVSVEKRDEADSKKAEAKALVDEDKAEIENAELDLSFTKITAPFSGRIEETLAHVGELVQKQQTELTTVVQVDPIYVISNISREQVYRVQQLQQQGLAPTTATEFTAQLVMPDGSIYSNLGKLNYISALIDPATDTTQVRFSFSNPRKGTQLSLIPGQYIPLRMIAGNQPDALLIPESALLQTQEGTYVYVVGKDNKVEKRMVTTGASHEHQWIIKKGLKKGEQVIAQGLQKVRPGMEVKIADTAAPKSPS
jgi:membrane fusion protein (multidrug efflux system)